MAQARQNRSDCDGTARIVMGPGHLLQQPKHTLRVQAGAPKAYVTGTALLLRQDVAVVVSPEAAHVSVGLV